MVAANPRRDEFFSGAKDTLPLVIGAIPFAILFGALGITNGLSPVGAQAMSVFVFAGSAQFIAAGLIAQGVPASVIILTTLVVNLRHALYSVSLAPHLRHLPQKWLALFGFWLTDETYAVVIRHFQKEELMPYMHWYYLGSALSMYLNWQVWTLIGILAGQRLRNAATWGLDFAMVVTFIGIVVPLIVNRPMLVTALVSGGVAVTANGLPHKLGLMLAALLGIGAGLAAESALGAQPAPPPEIGDPI